MLEGGELVTTTLALTRIIKLHQILTGFVTTDNTEHAIDNNRIAALLQIAETTRPLVVFYCL